MKIFQIYNSFCHWDATEALSGSVANAEGRYPADVVFVEAPDFVFEGWGYNENAEGGERFIRPKPPEGWIYDENTGTFYPEDAIPPANEPETDTAALLARIAALEEELEATKILLGVTE